MVYNIIKKLPFTHASHLQISCFHLKQTTFHSLEHSWDQNWKVPKANRKIQKSGQVNKIQTHHSCWRGSFNHQGTPLFYSLKASSSLRINYSTAKSILQNLKKHGPDHDYAKESTSPSCQQNIHAESLPQVQWICLILIFKEVFFANNKLKNKTSTNGLINSCF